MSQTEPNRYKPGQSVHMVARMRSAGGLIDPATITITLCDPNANETTLTATRNSQGQYFCDYVLPMQSTPGLWFYRWQITADPPAQNGLAERKFYVDPLDF